MNKKIKMLFMTVVTLFTMSGVVSNAAEFNFSVNTNIPTNQVDKQKTYFDLKMDPGANQTVSMVLKNTTDKDIVVQTEINSAKTNTNGVVEYGQTNIKKDKSLIYDMRDYITTQPEVKIPKHGQYTLNIDIKMPQEKLDGVLAGGISLMQKDNEDKKDSNSGAMIRNKFAYVVGIVLREDLNQKIQPDLLLNSVKATQSNYRNVIASNLQNYTPAYVNSVVIDAKAYKKGDTSKKTVYASSDKGMQMAPNSNFDYLTRLNGGRIKAGKYTMHMIVTSSTGRWEFDKDFEITKTMAGELNKKDVDIKDHTRMYMIIAVAVLILALIVFLIILLVKRKKKKDKEEGKEVESSVK
ncbi:MAG: DUF916 and DUF3324 domain-containing protein [Clostridioides sp.]|jgi:hypothetical protein|nr:DUF916 and DUF3324 domain-containing protein [Clostridioides sp.]